VTELSERRLIGLQRVIQVFVLSLTCTQMAQPWGYTRHNGMSCHATLIYTAYTYMYLYTVCVSLKNSIVSYVHVHYHCETTSLKIYDDLHFVLRRILITSPKCQHSSANIRK